MFRRSFRATIAALAIAVCAVASRAIYDVFEPVRRGWRHACAWVVAGIDWVFDRIKVESPKNPASPRRALIGAAQFLGRMIRRDRPLVSPRWRMCPSV
jgi:hypothetical protein